MQELQSVRGQLAAEQSRCFKLEVLAGSKKFHLLCSALEIVFLGFRSNSKVLISDLIPPGHFS